MGGDKIKMQAYQSPNLMLCPLDHAKCGRTRIVWLKTKQKEVGRNREIPFIHLS